MSIQFHLEINADYIENKCFLCGKEINTKVGFIYWSGMTSDIALHKNCAARFSAHLGSDLIKLKHKRIEIDSQLEVF